MSGLPKLFAFTSALMLLSACGGSDDSSAFPEGARSEASKPKLQAEATAPETVIDVIESDDQFAMLSMLIELSGLQDDLAEASQVTIFAPSSAAFNALPEDTLDLLRLPQNRQQLAELLRYHVAVGRHDADALEAGAETLVTLDGLPLSTGQTGDVLSIEDAVVTITDIEADNGLIHVIDAVLLPPVGQ